MTKTPEAAAITIRLAEPDDAAAVLGVVQAAFAARPPVDPPAAALSDTVDDVIAVIDAGGEVLLAEVDGTPAASLQVTAVVDQLDGEHLVTINRVSVVTEFRHLGLGAAIIRAGVLVATEMGATVVELLARREFPGNRRMWESHGFHAEREHPLGWIMRRELPVRLEVPDGPAMQHLGEAIAPILRAGDLLIASGELGAGKTTFTQGLARGLDVDGAVISPTFVISRVHHSRHDGPDLVHVDAYRLASAAEVDDLDLDETLAGAVTVVEWGEGLVESLSDSALHVQIQRSGDPDDETRTVLVWGEGPRWNDIALRTSLTWPATTLEHTHG
ncbi:tRNA (adenosine(37)-N6)-threonylcarbamoyltransferase complex ATPase subunit type 1 TsaE [Propionibacteriaceae bacterium G57]|uniref:tRNA (adenosine(37)-N6)-threonylcarbamoyltransferase complex ATPase subunit type 1 TsaE n=1 Tax=Aestuariimicrobium sp. G57 TaxID=3418485 RepID=UPI003DA79B16